MCFDQSGTDAAAVTAQLIFHYGGDADTDANDANAGDDKDGDDNDDDLLAVSEERSRAPRKRRRPW